MEIRSIGIDLGKTTFSPCSTGPKGRGACSQEVHAKATADLHR
jgi:hypothetical protein